MSTHCLHMRIDILLTRNDEELTELFFKRPAEVRELLEKKKAAGEVYIPSAGCEGFNPVTGCPGHGS